MCVNRYKNIYMYIYTHDILIYAQCPYIYTYDITNNKKIVRNFNNGNLLHFIWKTLFFIMCQRHYIYNSMTPLIYCVSKSKTLACNSLVSARYTQRMFLPSSKGAVCIFTDDV